MIYSNPHLELILEYNANVYELSNHEINFKINFWPQKGGHDYKGKVFIHSKKEFAEIEINDDPKNSNNFVIKKLSGRNDEWNITLCARWLMIGAYKEIRDFIVNALRTTNTGLYEDAIDSKIKYILKYYRIKSIDPRKYEKGCLECYYNDFGFMPPDNQIFDIR